MALERRLTTILAADVEGYGRLMGRDKAGTLAALKALRRDLVKPKEIQYSGRTVKLLGDGALMEFSSVVDALRFAVETQVAIAARNADVPEDRRIRYRIGLNIGDIVVEGDDIFGDGVNVAARLEDLSEPGGICLAQSVFDQVKDKLDLTFEPLGEREVKNLAAPVSVYRVVLDDKASALVTPVVRQPAPARPNRWPAIAAGLVLSLAGLGGLVLWQPWAPEVEPASVERMAFPLPAKPSIAVLPFANLSGDPEQEYFADGVTEDLITDLSKVSGLFVIARNSSFFYKGRQLMVRQVAEDLGVRYVLEGSVRRAGDAVRVTAQLIDATTGGRLWAERYDEPMVDLFALQDRVTRQIVEALAPRLAPAQQAAKARQETEDPKAYDAFLQGWAYYQRFSADDFAKAIPHFEKAIELDPGYGRPYAALASLYWKGWRQGDDWAKAINPDPNNRVSVTGVRDKADKFAELAVAHPTPLAHQVASAIQWDYRQFDAAIGEAKRAVALDPNDPDGHVALAWALIFDGSHREALESVERAMRLDPRRPGTYMYVLGMARMGLGQYDDAVAALRFAQEQYPEDRYVNLPLAAAYVNLGRDREARAALKRYTEVWTAFKTDVDGVLNWWPFRRESDIRHFGGGLVKAGLCCEETLDDYLDRLRQGGTLQ